MDDGYANGEYRSMEPPVVTQFASPPEPTMHSSDATITISAMEPELPEARLVNVYSQSITPVSYQGDDPIVKFDILFSVSCTCPDSGNVSTYQVVKRIGVDRQKLAQQAKESVPITVVEARKPNGGVPTSRFKTLAGL
jgi:hypothetical protein